VAAALGLELGMEAIVDEGVQVQARDEEHRPAPASVAPVGPASWYELLAPETETAVAAVARLHVDVDFVDEHEVTGT
jgi:hypothetical protein